jgi:hypothetical protein
MPTQSHPFKKILLTVVFGLFSVPMVGFGAYLFTCWMRIHFSDVYYADYSYIATALVLIGIGLLSFWVTWEAAWRRSFYGLLFIIPVFLGLASMVIIPNLPLPHTITLGADTNFIVNVTDSVRDWYEKRGRFPADDSEFREALAGRADATRYPAGPTTFSKYKQRGSSLPYAIVVVANSRGPRVADVSARPGVIYYCVSSDLQEFWITMTGLEADLGSTASLRQLTWWEKKSWIHRAGRDYSRRQQ